MSNGNTESHARFVMAVASSGTYVLAALVQAESSCLNMEKSHVDVFTNVLEIYGVKVVWVDGSITPMRANAPSARKTVERSEVPNSLLTCNYL